MGNKTYKLDLELSSASSLIIPLIAVQDKKEDTPLDLQVIGKLKPVKNQFNPRLDLTSQEIAQLCSRTRSLLLEEPTLLRLAGSFVVVGDIHGQFKDLRKIFAKHGYPPDTRYVFLGDYVDKGQRGIEVCLLLFAVKSAYPENIFLLRGNHECSKINKEYGLYEECRRRFGVAQAAASYPPSSPSSIISPLQPLSTTRFYVYMETYPYICIPWHRLRPSSDRVNWQTPG